MSFCLQTSLPIQPRTSPPKCSIISMLLYKLLMLLIFSWYHNGRAGEPDARALHGRPRGPSERDARPVAWPVSRPTHDANFAPKVFSFFFKRVLLLCQILEGSSSIIPKPIFASKFSYCSMFRALQYLRTFTPLQNQTCG